MKSRDGDEKGPNYNADNDNYFANDQEELDEDVVDGGQEDVDSDDIGS